MTDERCFEIALTIPDNEARTALQTLRRLGVPVAGLARADVYRFRVEPGTGNALADTVRSLETLFNPNKHALRVRDGGPEAGEVWIAEVHAATPSTGPVRIAGRLLAGVVRVERFTGWRLETDDGRPAPADVVRRATETLLCNPAFQKATTRV